MDDEYEGFCIDCDRKVPLIFKRRRVEQTEKGINFSYAEDYAICMHCGNKVYVPRLNDHNAKVRASAYFEEKKNLKEKEDKRRMNYMKRFIVFTGKDLEDIKAGKLVVTENCNFSEHDEPYDIFCVSEEWMKEYDNRDEKEI